MAARSTGSGTISFGLVSIPFKLYTATSPQSVRFNQLHSECGSRVKQQLYCPVCDKTVERSEIVKGYEYAKGQYVQFSDEELKQLEAEKTHTLDIVEFVPLEQVDLVQIEKSYYLGPDKGGAKAYHLLSDAMEQSGKVAVGRFWTRGKEQLVIVRPYRQGLLLHYVYYADEVRSFDEIDLGGDASYKDHELGMAQQLIDQLSNEEFQPERYRDEWRDRVMEAVEQKVAGEEVTAAPQQPAAQVIDLFEALKESLGTGGGEPSEAASAEAQGASSEAAAASETQEEAASAGGDGKGKKGTGKAGQKQIKPPRKTEPKSTGSRSRKKKKSTGSD